jgi:hypothetical protein
MHGKTTIKKNANCCLESGTRFAALSKWIGDSIKEDEMGGACGTYGEIRVMYRVW